MTMASLFPGKGGTPPEAVTLWTDSAYKLEKANAEKQHRRALAWLKGALPLAHKHSKVKDWIKRLLAVGDFTRNMQGTMQIFDSLQAFCRERLIDVGRPLGDPNVLQHLQHLRCRSA